MLWMAVGAPVHRRPWLGWILAAGTDGSGRALSTAALWYSIRRKYIHRLRQAYQGGRRITLPYGLLEVLPLGLVCTELKKIGSAGKPATNDFFNAPGSGRCCNRIWRTNRKYRDIRLFDEYRPNKKGHKWIYNNRHGLPMVAYPSRRPHRRWTQAQKQSRSIWWKSSVWIFAWGRGDLSHDDWRVPCSRKTARICPVCDGRHGIFLIIPKDSARYRWNRRLSDLKWKMLVR